ncbi:hypothetical protein K0U07_02660 [bacterium]|nr:hypothetical protein [bacterium]
MRIFTLFFLSVSLFAAEVVKPVLGYSVHDRYLQQMRTIFPKLTKEEKEHSWGKEYSIALHFAKDLDLYQAVATFKRARVLIPDHNIARRREIDYQIINAYYLGGKYEEVVTHFDHSLLANIEPAFPAFHDLLVILYDSLKNIKEEERASFMLKTMDKYFPLEKQKLEIGNAILAGDIDLLEKDAKSFDIETSIASLEGSLDENFFKESRGEGAIDEHTHSLSEDKLQSLYHLKECRDAERSILNDYTLQRKNPLAASSLNAILPGLGYLYLGQKQSALTALLLNTVTAGAAILFYKNDNLPAALLTLSFESGWYLGGIVGAYEEAEFYNRRMFEKAAHYRMRDHKLYPILMLRHGF